MDLTLATGELGTQNASHKPTASAARSLMKQNNPYVQRNTDKGLPAVKLCSHEGLRTWLSLEVR